jgi:adenosine deaminase
MSDSDTFIRGMPKAELHVHIEGTLEPELKFEMAARNGLSLPYTSVEEMRAGYVFTGLVSFLEGYYEGMTALVTEHDFRDLAYAYLARAHGDNIVYAELMFDPQAHADRGVPFEAVIEGLHAGQNDAEAEFGIRSSLILSFLREKSTDSAHDALRRGLAYRDWIAGVGLDSDETDHPPIKFRDVFDRARADGFKLTAHCGPDVDGVVDNIWQCVRDIEVDRIDHGVNAVVDPALMDAIGARGLCLTACPITRHGQAWAGPRHADSIRVMMDRGIKLSINTDDPAYFHSRYLADILLGLRDAISLTDAEIVTLTRNAFEDAWLPADERAAYLAALDAYVEAASGGG